jgi:hypothetical protein
VAGRTTILTPGPRQQHYWAITTDAEATGRHVQQTCCPGHFAVVTLRLEIDFGPDAVVFVNCLDERSPVWCVAMQDPAEANRTLGTDWEPFVAEVTDGVKEALAGLSPDGNPVQGLKVSLVGMKVHPVDSRGRDFRQAAVLAVTEAIRRAGLVERPS